MNRRVIKGMIFLGVWEPGWGVVFPWASLGRRPTFISGDLRRSTAQNTTKREANIGGEDWVKIQGIKDTIWGEISSQLQDLHHPRGAKVWGSSSCFSSCLFSPWSCMSVPLSWGTNLFVIWTWWTLGLFVCNLDDHLYWCLLDVVFHLWNLVVCGSFLVHLMCCLHENSVNQLLGCTW